MDSKETLQSLSLPSSKQALLQTFAGLLILAIAMGVGRFSYTALLPYMMESYGFNEKVAGTIATWNNIGYLLGTLAVFKVNNGQLKFILLCIFTLFVIFTTSLMGIFQTIPLWYCLRFICGFSSGVCFVLCSSIVLDQLLQLKKPAFSGFLYSGVGIGIALSGFCTQFSASIFKVDIIWIAMGLLSIPLFIIAFIILRKNNGTAKDTSQTQNTNKDNNTKKVRPTKDFTLLLFTYFLEGFGYIIGMTFIVSLVKTSTNSMIFANFIWIIIGITAAVSAPLWRLAVKTNYQNILIFAFFLQTIGSLLPILSNSPIIILFGAFLLGGTFMGITTLTLQYGTTLSSKSSTHTVALLTIAYGIGQILGPFITGLVANNRGFDRGFLMSAAALMLATLLLTINHFITQTKKV